MTDWSVIFMKHPASKKERILAAARKIIQDKSFHEMALDEVADGAQVAKGTLYLYFKNKEELFISIFKDIITENETKLSMVDDKDDMEYLKKVIEEKLNFLEKYSDFASKFMSHRYSLADLKRICEKFFTRHLEFMAQMLKTHLRELRLKNNDYFGFSMNMFFICRMYMLKKLLLGKRGHLSAYSGEILEILLDGWRIKKGDKLIR